MITRLLPLETKNEVYFGDQFYEDVKHLMLRQQIKQRKICLLTGQRSFRSSHFSHQLYSVMDELDNDIVYSFVVASNPRRKDIESSVKELQAKGVEDIVAVGGGSVIDYAKACKMLMPDNLNIFSIYTNTGSGSIVSPFIIYDNHEFKVGEHSENSVPTLAYVNKSIIESNPHFIIGGGVCDIYCHAVESYFSNVATDDSRQLSLQAVESLGEYLEKGNVEDLVVADLYAILSESQGIVLSPHALGHDLTYTSKIAHRYASIIFMESFLSHLKKMKTRVPDTFEVMLQQIIGRFGQYFPTTFPPAITEERMDVIERYMGFTIENSPVPVTRGDLVKIYTESTSRGLRS